MNFEDEYSLRKKAMERFRGLGDDPEYLKDMAKLWNNDIEAVIKKLAEVSFEKNTTVNELLFAKQTLDKYGTHIKGCDIESGACTCGYSEKLGHVKKALKETRIYE